MKNKVGYLTILCFVLSFTIQVININPIKNPNELSNVKGLNSSTDVTHIKEWIQNGDFNSQENWTVAKGELGDPTDVDASISNGEANYQVLGEIDTFSFVTDPPQSSDWRDIYNPDYPAYPDSHGINAEGCWFQHQFTESPLSSDQMASVHWEHKITTSVNMSDYVITSASLNAVFNATVDENIECPGDQADYSTTYDWARFYVLISNENNVSYEVAYYQMNDLGVGDTPGNKHDKINTNMLTIPEESLILFLTSVLSYDYRNFNITLGIKVWCEDNRGIETDDWDYLLINKFNLTFTYEKKIDQLTSISWNQVGDKPSDISINPIVINAAILNFQYKINDTWPSVSPNSELRILINDIPHSETVKLSEGIITFKDAKTGGFDVTSLINKDKNVNLSLQVYLADQIELDRIINISIDDVSLNITYTEDVPDILTNIQLFLNSENKTDNPVISLPLGEILNVTIKYTYQTGDHVLGADVQLEGEVNVPLSEDLTLQQYSTIINTSLLGVGVKILTITAQKIYFQSKSIDFSIVVRKIETDIKLITGNDIININPGENVNLQVYLNDTDFNLPITGALVLYNWDFGQGILSDDNNDGIYEVNLNNIPSGSHIVTISVFGSEDYVFQDYQITINVISGGSPDWTLLIIILSVGMVGLIGFFTLYQTHYKYPPTVRKSRKIRKKIRKSKKTKPVKDIASREDLIKTHLEKNVETIQLEKKTEKGLKEK